MALVLWAATAAADSPADPGIVDAIARVVQLRMGSGVDVSVVGLRVTGAVGSAVGLQAVPEPGAMVGGPMRFALRARGRGGRPARVGLAEAVVMVRALHARASRDIARGTVIADEDIEMVIDQVGRGPLKPLPRVTAGMKALRDIRGGEVLSARMFAALPLVKAGDEVLMRAFVGGVEVTGRAIAAQNGHYGRVIRVVNPESGKRLRGRVVGQREVEVVHET